MPIETFATTDVGKQRDHNEDAALATALGEDAALLAVADGMGGHAAGDVASQLAIDTLRESIVESASEFPPRSEWTERLESVIKDANAKIHDHAAAQPERSGMGTTLVAALVQGREAVIANVGDSRAYAETNAGFEQVTVDQSLVQELVEQGTISEAEADDHPQRNVVSQALGTDEDVEPDFYEVTSPQRLLLCSDGLTEEVDDGTIERFVSEREPLADIADRLVARANKNGGSDNVSVVLGDPT